MNSGNRSSATVSAAGEKSRVIHFTYDDNRQYIVSKINGFGHVVESVISRNPLGQPTVVEDIRHNQIELSTAPWVENTTRKTIPTVSPGPPLAIARQVAPVHLLAPSL